MIQETEDVRQEHKTGDVYGSVTHVFDGANFFP